MNRLLPLAVLLCLQLSACSLLPAGEPRDLYRLPASPLPAAATPGVPWTLRVNTPDASLLLDSTRIAVLPQGDRVSVYRGVRWSDRAPVLLRDRLIDALRDDGRIAAVSSDASRLPADLQLGGDLRAFQAEYVGGRPEAHILFEARLIDGASQRILASRRFLVRQAAADASLQAVVSAFGQAADRLAAELLAWTLAKGQDAYSPTQ